MAINKSDASNYEGGCDGDDVSAMSLKASSDTNSPFHRIRTMEYCHDRKMTEFTLYFKHHSGYCYQEMKSAHCSSSAFLIR